MIGDNWVISTLEWALESWNGKLSELWDLLTQTPESFKGGDIWEVIVTINSALQGVGYGLLVLFFAMGVFQSAASFREIQRPEYALRHFIRFAAAKVAVGYGMEIMIAIFSICGGVVQTVMGSIGGAVGALLIIVLSFVLILTVYGRFFRLYLYTALSPLPLASFAGEGTSGIGKAFIKSYVGVCMEGAVIILACLIYSAFMSSSTPAVDTSLPAVTMAFQYVGQLIFNMLVLTALVKGAERIVREMFGL